MTVFALALFLFVGFDEDVISGIEFNVEVAEGERDKRSTVGYRGEWKVGVVRRDENRSLDIQL